MSNGLYNGLKNGVANGLYSDSKTPDIVRQNLVLHYDAAKLICYPGQDSSIKDLSGKNNNGTLVNGVGYNNDNNRKSLVFDGSNDYASTINIISFSSSQSHTYSAWIYLTTGGTYIWIIDNGGGTTGSSLVINNTFKVGFFYAGGNALVASTTSISTNTWVNIVAVYSNLTAYFYINGVFINSASTGSWSAAAVPAALGVWAANFGYKFTGRMGQASVYNRALTSTEVLMNFSANKLYYGL